MNKKWAGILAAIALAVLTVFAVLGVFSPAFKNAQEKIQESYHVLSSPEILGKKTLESEWESKKNIFVSGRESSEFLNEWLKEFINYAQSNSLKIEKVEPAGVKEGPAGKETTVFISFQSDMRKFNEFVYFLLEKDPLAKIESVFVRKDEDSKNLSFEIMLGKTVA